MTFFFIHFPIVNNIKQLLYRFFSIISFFISSPYNMSQSITTFTFNFFTPDYIYISNAFFIYGPGKYPFFFLLNIQLLLLVFLNIHYMLCKWPIICCCLIRATTSKLTISFYMNFTFINFIIYKRVLI